MKKRLAALALAAGMCLLVACAGTAPERPQETTPAPALSVPPVETPPPGVTKDTVKIGVLYAEGEGGDTGDHQAGTKDMLKNLGIKESQYLPQFNVAEQDQAAIRAAVTELVDAGCHILFATSSAYGPVMLEAAGDNPNIAFCVAGGAEAGDAPNYHTYFAKIHQGRYLAGIAAGMKTQSDCIGYVATSPNAESISGFTAFYLGAKSVHPEVVMHVMYTHPLDGAGIGEKEAAEELIESGADVISQHTAGKAAALAAQERKVWHVGYGGDRMADAPQASLISTRIDWSVYMTYAVQCILNGQPIAADWSGGLAEGAVLFTQLNETAAAVGTKEAIADSKARLEAGTLHVFAGPLKDGNGNPAVITDMEGNVLFQFDDEHSVYMESDVYSAPGFNVLIGGITLIGGQ